MPRPDPVGESAPVTLGVIMLQTRFPRPVGDVGNPDTFACPVLHEVVPGATPERAVLRDPTAWLTPFVAAGKRLVARGATLVTTSCGFLAPFQDALAAALPVPVVASSLAQAWRVPRPAVLTVSLTAFRRSGLHALLPPGTPVAGLDGTAFARTVLEDRPTLDEGAARRDHVLAATRLVLDHPATRTIVLECTNMPPHAAAIADRTGRPVRSIVTAVNEAMAHAAMARGHGSRH